MRAYRVPSARAWGALLGIWVVVSGSPFAHADGEGEAVLTPGRALPGLVRVGTAGALAPGVAVSAASGYGFTEAVLGQDDAHHRARTQLALSYRPNSWLGLAASFDARYDRHLGDGIDDSGYVGDPRITARALRLAPGELTLGAETTLWLPGERAPSIVPGAATLDAKGLLTYLPAGQRGHALHANAGFRIDRSAASAPNADRLSLSQRLTLGVSDSDALLVGAGWTGRMGWATAFAEWSWDVHVGSAAPSPLRSPMRLSGGLNRRVGDVRVFGVGEVGLSARPGLDRSDPLVPVEPRMSLLVGVSYHFGARGRQGHAQVAAPGAVAGRVSVVGGGGLEGAEVRIRAGDVEATVQTDETGAFEVDDIPAGQAGILARAPGHREQSVAVQIEPGGTLDVEIELERDLPDGQLKGLVLSFDGAPIAASIQIEPGDIEIAAGDDGEFDVDLPPGSYVVSISAPGHRDQERFVTVERRGVTVLNIDMRRER